MQHPHVFRNAWFGFISCAHVHPLQRQSHCPFFKELARNCCALPPPFAVPLPADALPLMPLPEPLFLAVMLGNAAAYASPKCLAASSDGLSLFFPLPFHDMAVQKEGNDCNTISYARAYAPRGHTVEYLSSVGLLEPKWLEPKWLRISDEEPGRAVWEHHPVLALREPLARVPSIL